MFVAGAFGLCFRKKIEYAIAPAFLIQILIMIFTAMVFDTLSLGIIICVMLAFICFGVVIIKNKSITCVLEQYVPTSDNVGIVILIIFYAIVYVTNYGCTYSEWDEFSHWGIFVKEMFRLDKLYCTSTASMAHKDYVPAISVFELLWCRLSFRYSEADAYRGIQMLQGAMMLPLITVGNGRKRKLELLARSVLAFGLPLYFGAFYHTIYQDLIYGVLVFYCIFIIVTEKESMYKTAIITVALSVLVLAKMTALAFLPMIIAFYFVWTIKFESCNSIKKVIVQSGVASIIPLLLWGVFNRYVDCFVPNSGSGQSYDSISVNTLISVLFHNGSIEWQSDVDFLYLKALFLQGVVLKIAFVPFILILACIIFVVSKVQNDEISKAKAKLINLWVMLASIAYVIMMYYLYMTAFSEYEARTLASYSRYMQTMGIAALFITLLVVFNFANAHIRNVVLIGAVIVLENALLFLNLNQLIPGVLQEEFIEYESEANAINSHSDENSSICLITCGSSGDDAMKIMYQCSPRIIDWMSPGPSRYVGDVWSNDIEASDFASFVTDYDLVYLLSIDDEFIEKYSEAFYNPDAIENHRLYYVSNKAGEVILTDVEGK